MNNAEDKSCLVRGVSRLPAPMVFNNAEIAFLYLQETHRIVNAAVERNENMNKLRDALTPEERVEYFALIRKFLKEKRDENTKG